MIDCSAHAVQPKEGEAARTTNQDAERRKLAILMSSVGIKIGVGNSLCKEQLPHLQEQDAGGTKAYPCRLLSYHALQVADLVEV